MKARRPAQPRAARKAATREALLDAARAVIARHGLAGATTRRIALAAGVSVGTFFVHFPDTGALVQALLDELLERALTTALASVPRGGDLVEELLHVSGELYRAYDAEPALSRAYITASLFPTTAGDGVADARLAQFQAWVTGRLEAAIRARKVPRIEPALAFGGFFSLYFGVLVAGLRGQLDRAGQLAMLEAALRRFLLLEKERRR